MRWTGLLGARSCWATMFTLKSFRLKNLQARRDSNPQPSALETDALPLSYSPIFKIKSIRYLCLLKLYGSAASKSVVLLNWRPKAKRTHTARAAAPQALAISFALPDRHVAEHEKRHPTLGALVQNISICNYSIIFVTTPAPTVRPPSRIANRRPSSQAIRLCSSMSS